MKNILALIICFTLIGCTQNNVRKIDTTEVVPESSTIPSSDNATATKSNRHKIPPIGFEWVTHAGVVLPRPIKWHEHMDGYTYSTSIESVPEEGVFQTGATIQVIRDVQSKYGIPASVYAIEYISHIDNKTENTKLHSRFRKTITAKIFTYRYRNSPSVAEPAIIHTYIVASDVSSYVAIVTFESHETTWNKYWNGQGKIMLSNMSFTPY
ncbi:MAG: hypothetical protein ABW166_09925 [Sedimenticola sp.]